MSKMVASGNIVRECKDCGGETEHFVGRSLWVRIEGNPVYALLIDDGPHCLECTRLAILEVTVAAKPDPDREAMLDRQLAKMRRKFADKYGEADAEKVFPTMKLGENRQA